MNLNSKSAFAYAIGGLFFAGCSSGGSSPITADQDSVKKATEMRAYYNKTSGDYSKLTAEEKASFKKDIAPGLAPEKVWQNLAPQKANMPGSGGVNGDPRAGK